MKKHGTEPTQSTSLPQGIDQIRLRRGPISGWKKLTATLVAGFAVAGCATEVSGIAMPAGEQIGEATAVPLAPELSKQLETKPVSSDLCQTIPFASLKKWLVSENILDDDFRCASTPSGALFPLTGKRMASGSWTHDRAVLRQIDVQLYDDRSDSGTSTFKNLIAEYPQSEAHVIKGYQARFIADLGAKATRRDPKLKGISGTIVNIPTPEGAIDMTIAVQYGGGFGGDNFDIAKASRTIETSALTNAIPAVLPKLPQN